MTGPRGFPCRHDIKNVSGAVGDRTPDLRIANAALSQLSYDPNEGAESSLWLGCVNPKAAPIMQFWLSRVSFFARALVFDENAIISSGKVAASEGLTALEQWLPWHVASG